MTERSPKICLISPTENLARRAKPLIMRRGMDVRVEVAELEAAVSLAKRLLTQNDYLFISRRGTRDLLRKSLNIQVVNIPGEASDYIPAIQQLRHERGLIAFFSFEEEISNELRTICYLLDLKMKHYCFSDSLSCQSAVQQAVADGAAWGLGGIVSERFAKLYDLPYLRVESSDASILHALDTAQQLYVTQQENARQQEQLQIQLERYQNILDYTHDAIVAIDENGRISTTNQIAEQMLRPAQPPSAQQALVHRLVHCVQGGGIPRQIQPGRPVQPPLERLNPLHIFLLIQDGSPPFLKGLSPVRRGGWGVSLAD